MSTTSARRAKCGKLSNEALWYICGGTGRDMCKIVAVLEKDGSGITGW